MATMNKGFTLIEMVVVTGLIGMLSVGLVSIFISTTSGNRRAKLFAVIKEQGDYAITSMERTIRNSPTMPKCSGGPPNTIITFSQPGDSKTHAYMIAGTDLRKSDDYTNPTAPQPSIIGSNMLLAGGSFECIPDLTGFSQGKVRIQFNAMTTIESLREIQSFETTVAIRTIK